MMKKLGLFAFVMALVVAFALPALAYTVEGAKGERFTLGGSLRYDIGYRTESHASNDGVPGSDFFGSAQDRGYSFTGLSTSSNIYGMFTVGPVSGFWQLNTGSSTESYHKQDIDHQLNSPYSVNSATWNSGIGVNQKDNAWFDTMYGTYTFGAMSIQAGKMSPVTVIAAPSPGLGYTQGAGGHIVGIAYGFIYDNKSPQLRFNHTISKQFSYVVALVAPGTYAEDLRAAGAAAAVIRESHVDYPALAASVRMNFGAVGVFPGFLYQSVHWDNLPAGWTDKMDSWFIRVPVKLTFGAFTAWLEGVYGQNIGGKASQFTTVAASEPDAAGYGRLANGTIANGNTLNFWFDFSYKIGAIAPHLYYGQTTSSSSRARYPVGLTETTRSFVGVNLFYDITPNFKIVPEFTMYDLGKNPGMTNYKIGNDWLAGVQFQFNF